MADTSTIAMGATTEEFSCDRCCDPVRVLYLSKNLAHPSVEVIGTPWYCEECMLVTGQSLQDTARVIDYRKTKPYWVRQQQRQR